MIKAIETRYKGYRFRSRLEARWAVLFDSLGWKWEYEIEGFTLPSGRYLPDFLLCASARFTERGADRWVEVKAVAPTKEEITLAKELVLATKQDLLFLIGAPSVEGIVYGVPFVSISPDAYEFSLPEDAAFYYKGQGQSLSHYCLVKWGRPGIGMELPPDKEDIAAVEKARSARFEYGESP